MIGIYLVHGLLHLFMVQVDYRLFGTGWCMVDALVDAGASTLHQASQHVEGEEQLDCASTHIFEFTLKILLRRRLYECIHMKRTCNIL
jgi:hypothetical protein